MVVRQEHILARLFEEGRKRRATSLRVRAIAMHERSETAPNRRIVTTTTCGGRGRGGAAPSAMAGATVVPAPGTSPFMIGNFQPQGTTDSLHRQTHATLLSSNASSEPCGLINAALAATAGPTHCSSHSSSPNLFNGAHLHTYHQGQETLMHIHQQQEEQQGQQREKQQQGQLMFPHNDPGLEHPNYARRDSFISADQPGAQERSQARSPARASQRMSHSAVLPTVVTKQEPSSLSRGLTGPLLRLGQPSCTLTSSRSRSPDVNLRPAEGEEEEEEEEEDAKCKAFQTLDNNTTSTRLQSGGDVIMQNVLLERLSVPGARNRDITEFFTFWRPKNACKSAKLQHLSDKQHDILYAVAGCADVKFRIGNVNENVRRALSEMYGLTIQGNTSDLQVWYKNRGNREKHSKPAASASAGSGSRKRNSCPAPTLKKPMRKTSPQLMVEGLAKAKRSGGMPDAELLKDLPVNVTSEKSRSSTGYAVSSIVKQERSSSGAVMGCLDRSTWGASGGAPAAPVQASQDGRATAASFQLDNAAACEPGAAPRPPGCNADGEAPQQQGVRPLSLGHGWPGGGGLQLDRSSLPGNSGMEAPDSQQCPAARERPRSQALYQAMQERRGRSAPLNGCSMSRAEQWGSGEGGVALGQVQESWGADLVQCTAMGGEGHVSDVLMDAGGAAVDGRAWTAQLLNAASNSDGSVLGALLKEGRLGDGPVDGGWSAAAGTRELGLGQLQHASRAASEKAVAALLKAGPSGDGVEGGGWSAAATAGGRGSGSGRGLTSGMGAGATMDAGGAPPPALPTWLQEAFDANPHPLSMPQSLGPRLQLREDIGGNRSNLRLQGTVGSVFPSGSEAGPARSCFLTHLQQQAQQQTQQQQQHQHQQHQQQQHQPPQRAFLANFSRQSAPETGRTDMDFSASRQVPPSPAQGVLMKQGSGSGQYGAAELMVPPLPARPQSLNSNPAPLPRGAEPRQHQESQLERQLMMRQMMTRRWAATNSNHQQQQQQQQQQRPEARQQPTQQQQQQQQQLRAQAGSIGATHEGLAGPLALHDEAKRANSLDPRQPQLDAPGPLKAQRVHSLELQQEQLASPLMVGRAALEPRQCQLDTGSGSYQRSQLGLPPAPLRQPPASGYDPSRLQNQALAPARMVLPAHTHEALVAQRPLTQQQQQQQQQYVGAPGQHAGAPGAPHSAYLDSWISVGSQMATIPNREQRGLAGKPEESAGGADMMDSLAVYSNAPNSITSSLFEGSTDLDLLNEQLKDFECSRQDDGPEEPGQLQQQQLQQLLQQQQQQLLRQQRQHQHQHQHQHQPLHDVLVGGLQQGLETAPSLSLSLSMTLSLYDQGQGSRSGPMSVSFADDPRSGPIAAMQDSTRGGPFSGGPMSGDWMQV